MLSSTSNVVVIMPYDLSTCMGWEPCLVPLPSSLSIKVVSVDEAYTLDPKVALHIRALDNYSDQFGIQR